MSHPKVDAFFDGIDAVALRVRVYMKSLFWGLIALNGLIHSEYMVSYLPKPGTKLAGATFLLNALVGYYTLRSQKQAASLKEVERVGGSAAMARVPTPITSPAIPSLRGPSAQ